MVTKGSEEHVLGYLPVDFSFHFSTLMEENRDYYTIQCKLLEGKRADRIEIGVNFLDDILKDQRIMDKAIGSAPDCTSYSVKDFWGMPKILQKTIHNLHSFNANKEVGFEYLNTQEEVAVIEEDESESPTKTEMKTEEEE